MQVTVDIPDDFVSVLAPEGEDAGRRLLEDRTAQAYRDGKLTAHQVQRILDLPNRMAVDPFLLKYKIYDYTAEMLRSDLQLLETLHG